MDTRAFLDAAVQYSDANQLSRGYPPGEVLFHEGDEGTDIYVLQKGCVAVVRNNIKIAGVREPGAILGEMSSLLSQRRSATLRIEEPSRLIRLTAAQFQDLLLQYPHAGNHIAEMMAQRIARDAVREEQDRRKYDMRIREHEEFLKIVYTLINLLKERQPSPAIQALHEVLFSNPGARIGLPIHEIPSSKLPEFFRTLLKDAARAAEGCRT